MFRKKKNYTNLLNTIIAESKLKISLVIPTWNEAPRIGKVLDVVCTYPFFNEIIIVDDGSTDNTKEVLSPYLQKYKHLKLITHTHNLGKTDAVRTGIKQADGPIVALVDGDLVGLNHENLNKMLYYVANGDYAMTILDRAGDRQSPIGIFSSIISRILGGERAFWKSDFEKMKFKDGDGYNLEVIMNQYYFECNKRVRTIYCPNLFNAFQFKKHGLIGGLKRYSKMRKDILNKTGIKNYFLQFSNTDEDRLISLHNLYRMKRMKILTGSTLLAGGLILSILTFFSLNTKRAIKTTAKTGKKILLH
jgi:glycosyltransferase involved in cell wall biosynthesis